MEELRRQARQCTHDASPDPIDRQSKLSGDVFPGGLVPIPPQESGTGCGVEDLKRRTKPCNARRRVDSGDVHIIIEFLVYMKLYAYVRISSRVAKNVECGGQARIASS